MAIARAGVSTAQGQQISSRAERLPQLSSSPSYSRTLISQFSGTGDGITQDSTTGGSGGFDTSQAGFGAANSYNLAFSVSQTLYDGGRIGAAQSYYDALLSARLLEIAEASLAQAGETLRLAELAFKVGDKGEYDILRARVVFPQFMPLYSSQVEE